MYRRHFHRGFLFGILKGISSDPKTKLSKKYLFIPVQNITPPRPGLARERGGRLRPILEGRYTEPTAQIPGAWLG
jgi:hypothetical protein